MVYKDRSKNSTRHYSRRILERIVSAIFLVLLGNLLQVANLFAVNDTYWTSPNSGDWFDAANWGGPIPNAPGDIAHLRSTSSGAIDVTLSAPVTLGQLDFFGLSDISLAGNGPLVFDTPGSGIIRLNIVSTADNFDIGVPLGIADEDKLLAIVPTDVNLAFTEGITVGNGDMTKTGMGTIELSGASPSWNGVFRANQGLTIIRDPEALGSSTGHTVVNGGTIQLFSAVDDPFTLQAGVLQTGGSTLTLGSHLTVPAGNTAAVQGRFRIQGGSSGDGDLHLVASNSGAITVSNTPLSHAGGLTISSGETFLQYAGIDVDNTYQGHTIVSDVRLSVSTDFGLGTTDVGTTVVNGELRLLPTSQEDIRLENSTLSFYRGNDDVSLNRYQGNIVLSSGTISTYAPYSHPDQYTIVNPIVLDGGMNVIEPEDGALRIEGGIVGSGNLLLNPDRNAPVIVASKIQHQGELEIDGPVHFIIPDVYSKTIFSRNGGFLYVEAPQVLERFSTLEVNSTDYAGSGSIEVSQGSSLTVDKVHIHHGYMQGNIISDSPIGFHGFNGGRTIKNLESGVNVNVWAGELTLDDSDVSRPTTSGGIFILRTSDASIRIAQDSIIDADLHLNNGSGFNYGGALRTENDSYSEPAIIARGDIYLGSQGAHIGGGDSIIVEGQIYGGDLNLGRIRSTPGLAITSGAAAYTGKTNIFSGEIALAEQGRLANTSSINLYSGGALYIDNAPADGPNSDRVDDSLQINMHGGELSAWPTAWGVDVTERIGKVHLERGRSFVRGVYFNGRGSLESVATLVVGELTRNPGSILSLYGTADQRSSMQFAREEGPDAYNLVLENPPAEVNGILPPWLMTAPTQFSTIGPNGIEPYLGPTVDFIGSDSTSLVRPTSRTLDQDRVIHSWNSFGSAPSVDLDGHTLTVGSGGLIGAELSNGTLLPGEYSNGELVIATEFVMDADIADNGRPTSVIYVGEGHVGGNNTYSGKTYVVGSPGDDVRITNAAALPTGGDIDISGYTDLVLRDLAGNVAYQFGKVDIRDGGTLISNCCGNGDTVAAEEFNLEAGGIYVPLTGNVEINKRTTGLATIGYESPGFVGNVNVYEGILKTDGVGYLALGQADVTVHPDASLLLTPIGESNTDGMPIPSITLAGGSLIGTGVPRDYQINSKGTLEVAGNSKIYLLDGLEADPRTTYFKHQGAIHIHAGQSLTIVGRHPISGGLYVYDGFQFDPGAILAGVGDIVAVVDIKNDAILSPGLLMEQPVGTLRVNTTSRRNEALDSKLIFGENGRYRWEINSVNGDPGAPFGFGWDLINAGPELLVEATTENPFVIEIHGLDEEGNNGIVADLIPGINYRWRIAEVKQINAFVGEITGFDPEKFAIDVSQLRSFYPHAQASDFWLEHDGPAIYLNGIIAVPEPNTLILFSLVGLIFTACRKRRHMY